MNVDEEDRMVVCLKVRLDSNMLVCVLYKKKRGIELVLCCCY